MLFSGQAEDSGLAIRIGAEEGIERALDLISSAVRSGSLSFLHVADFTETEELAPLRDLLRERLQDSGTEGAELSLLDPNNALPTLEATNVHRAGFSLFTEPHHVFRLSAAVNWIVQGNLPDGGKAHYIQTSLRTSDMHEIYRFAERGGEFVINGFRYPVAPIEEVGDLIYLEIPEGHPTPECNDLIEVLGPNNTVQYYSELLGIPEEFVLVQFRDFHAPREQEVALEPVMLESGGVRVRRVPSAPQQAALEELRTHMPDEVIAVARSHDSSLQIRIDLEMVASNFEQVKAISGSDDPIAVVKSYLYGVAPHTDVIETLYEAGCRKFWVEHVDEALEVQRVLNEAFPGEVHDTADIYVVHSFREGIDPGAWNFDKSRASEHQLVPVVHRDEHIAELARLQEQVGTEEPISCVLHFNTGMNRWGFNALAVSPEEREAIARDLRENAGYQAYIDSDITDHDCTLNMSLEDLAALREAGKLDHLDVRLLTSHFGAADNPHSAAGGTELEQLRLYHYGGDQHRNEIQLKGMRAIRDAFPGIPTSFSNSSALFMEGASELCDHPRAGLALWGGNPALGYTQYRHSPFLPAITLETTVRLPERDGVVIDFDSDGVLDARTYDLPILKEMAEHGIPISINSRNVTIKKVDDRSGKVWIDNADLQGQIPCSAVIIGENNRYDVADLLPRIAHYAIVDAITAGSRDVSILTVRPAASERQREFRAQHLKLLRDAPSLAPVSPERDKHLPLVSAWIDHCIEELDYAASIAGLFVGVRFDYVDAEFSIHKFETALEMLDKETKRMVWLASLHQLWWDRMPSFLPGRIRALTTRAAVGLSMLLRPRSK